MSRGSQEATGVRSVSVPDRLFFRIGEVADLLGVKTHVLRYWETEFPMVSPKKSGAGHRVYQKTEVETLVLIRKLLYEERFSIEGARRFLKELRQDGALKSARQKVLGKGPASGATSSGWGGDGEAKSKESKRLAQELKRLALTPVTQFFKY